MSIDVDIVAIGGERFELRHDGTVLRTVRRGYAEYYAIVEERRLRKALGRPRACMCCQATFTSEGSHHRLCDDCRRR